jgi:rfaE bifunctional protein kinase chain/domain
MDISKFNKCRVLVIGDLIIDEYVWGEVDRISPEAPVQIVSVKNEDFTLGGAGNVVNNLVALGARVAAVGVTGAGRNGKRLLEKLKEIGVNTQGVTPEAGRPTTRKTRIIAANQHVLRIDKEVKKEISDRSFELLSDVIAAQIPAVDIVLISDYGKGVVTPALLVKLIKTAQKHRKITIADPKGLDFTRYSGVSVLTPNLKEASLVAGIDNINSRTPFDVGEKILGAIDVENLLITCGKEGMVLFERGQAPLEIKAESRQVYDVSGAGDTVLAVFGLLLATGIPMKDAAAIANKAAGIVVGKVGTATVSKDELTAVLNPLSL